MPYSDGREWWGADVSVLTHNRSAVTAVTQSPGARQDGWAQLPTVWTGKLRHERRCTCLSGAFDMSTCSHPSHCQSGAEASRGAASWGKRPGAGLEPGKEELRWSQRALGPPLGLEIESHRILPVPHPLPQFLEK